jgi:GNAT superfamily N-acetyltransferase
MNMHIRAMTELDVPAGLRLNHLAGWNQTSADWHRFLNASPEGCFVAQVEARVCGTATTFSYQNRFAWIAMVLVDPEFQKRGIGTQLLKKAVEYLDQRCIPTLKLDATPQGQPLYAKLGFLTEYQIERWVLERPLRNVVEKVNPCSVHLTEGELALIFAMDRDVFGADRSFLLRSLHDESQDFAMSIFDRGEPQGYAFGRRGTFADHLGPWMAQSRSIAEKLLHEFLNRSTRETLLVDCMTPNPFANELLRACGFTQTRILTRMYRGPNTHSGNPGSLCAIAGPEFG